MKIPVSPPSLASLFEKHSAKLGTIFTRELSPEVRGRYEHWDHLRHLTPPDGLDVELWWLGIKWARKSLSRTLPLLDKAGRPFTVSLSNSIQRRLFGVAKDAAGALQGADSIPSQTMKDRYLVRSLMEEAMTSSQLEGAATTTPVAKEMLRTGREPRDYSERMIYNNFVAMRELKRWLGSPLTPKVVFEIHRLLTDGTMQDPSAAGRFRTTEEQIVVGDESGRVLHEPPPATQLKERMERLCAFANEGDDDEHFIHPVVRAVIIHFMIGYDHPFVDGNGRTARALFYWSMLRSGFWMTEYFSISSILKNAPAQYNRSFLYTETDEGDTSYFVAHQLDVLMKAIDGVHSYIARKQQAQKQAELLLKPGTRLARSMNHRQRLLLINALRNPDRVFTIAEHQGIHAVSYQTARSDLLGLSEAKLFLKRKDGKAFIFLPSPDISARIGTN